MGRYVPLNHPTPRYLCHTARNRNPNSNNRKLIRDPLNTPYTHYTASDIAKLFGLSIKTVSKYMQSGIIANCIPDNNRKKTAYRRGTVTEIHNLLAPAPSVLAFCQYYHDHYIKIKHQPAYIFPVLVTAASWYHDNYDENGSARSTPLSCETGETPE